MGQRVMIYANYGVLGRDKQPVYSEGSHGEIYDELTVELPEYITRTDGDDGLGVYEIDGMRCTFAELIYTHNNDQPGFRWHDGKMDNYALLDVVDA